MGKYGKWIGGGLGWVLGGPIGGLLGFLFGSMFDGMQSSQFEWRPPIGEQSSEPPYERYRRPTAARTQPGDFTVSLMVLAAAVMKADGRVLKSELEYVKTFLRSQFPDELVQQSLLILREMLDKNFDLSSVAQQVGRYMDYSSKLQLLHFLFGISQADGVSHPGEIEVIQTIASFMGIKSGDFESIKAMFVKDNQNNYKILEISPEASNEEVKKAYRKMAVKYHPDKVEHLGQDIKEAAKKKFQDLNAAYEAIKKERGMN